MAENRDMQAWLAPIAGTGLAAPIRISVRSEIGMVQIEATRFQAPASAADATGSTTGSAAGSAAGNTTAATQTASQARARN
jgi:hypothetical protein